uniref:DM2 domain-containing protein n=1 Tax=Attheya septentrionalis TaxID=420275 RepID=A0A7S2U805_9STRA|mmetsp:Transcript_12667/g.22928  ORF Transcript_12667/g.22928 Transcript_12667/m.22928 type:complete len:302 (+) Transcript_12667:205-1110(+)|eukprot:CAMPEP_0198283140 /NCGR_PEP_ID=MMETSP1449-20131203/2819_1 /TAXON_ID=420275 /ORGANISM="Attheya septentrionalis, Strain CCMP2084" /LENGTH=301 /DNA_ID=CAMNT_0043979661 /DNA_START=160 /DNA_END=1065 /DNA_ORIENTATION=+
MAEPSDEDIRLKMEELVPKVNLETMTTKQFMALLSKKMGGSKLSHKKKFIKQSITEILDAMDDEETEEQDTVSDEDESEEEIEVPKKKRAGGGLTAEKELSPELAKLLGLGNKLARTAVVKGLWDYIKKHNLQNPEDRREIILDKRLYAMFGVKKFTMFSMNKYIGAHIHPFTPVDLTKESESSKKRKAAKKDKKKGVKKPRKAGGQTPFRLSDELALVVGKSILPRPQVTQGLWKYIKERNLQNPLDMREIFCDSKLAAVMGKKKVTMFSMNKLVTPHLLEKLEKTDYVHEEEEKPEEEE